MAIRDTIPKGYIWLNDEESELFCEGIKTASEVASDQELDSLIQLIRKFCIKGNNLTHKDLEFVQGLVPALTLSFETVEELAPKLVKRMKQFGTGGNSTNPNSNVAKRRQQWLEQCYTDQDAYTALILAATQTNDAPTSLAKSPPRNEIDGLREDIQKVIIKVMNSHEAEMEKIKENHAEEMKLLRDYIDEIRSPRHELQRDQRLN